MGNILLLRSPTGSIGNNLNYVLQSLQSGINNGLGVQDDGSTGNTAIWMNDATGPFARLTYTNPGTFGLRWGFSTTGIHQIYVRYDVRRNNNLCSKQCKVYGWGLINGGATSNATFGCTMGGYSGTGYGLYYGDVATGSNDVSVEIACSGYPTNSLPSIGFGSAFSRTPYPIQAVTSTVTQDISGTAWETYEIFSRFSDPATNNGEFAIWKNGSPTPVCWLTNAWNCSTTTQDRGGAGLGEYSSSFGFYEDYRNLLISFDRPVGRGI